MGQPGIGVMLNMLGGGQMISKEQFDSIVDQTIKSVTLKGDVVVTFEDGRELTIWDGGQSCCENRYITTDDDLAYFAGSKFMDASIGEHRRVTDDHSDEHEIQFLNVRTSKGVITFETHNEHNGYYGGFAINAKLQ